MKYTPSEANELLPWLTRQLEHVASVATTLGEARRAVQSLSNKARGNGSHDLGPQLGEAEKTAGNRLKELEKAVTQIRDRGIQIRDLEIGLVDFPGEREGRPVWLCWKRGEPEVAFWHEHDEGYTSRQPL
ncbi:MAG: DUF2203 domain-containing protein [Chloroflexi bacterium]|nr:DUF2203 domain-containing protein [Chloroflexota bacterium]